MSDYSYSDDFNEVTSSDEFSVSGCNSLRRKGNHKLVAYSGSTSSLSTAQDEADEPPNSEGESSVSQVYSQKEVGNGNFSTKAAGIEDFNINFDEKRFEGCNTGRFYNEKRSGMNEPDHDPAVKTLKPDEASIIPRNEGLAANAIETLPDKLDLSIEETTTNPVSNECNGDEIKKLPAVKTLQVDAIRNILEGNLAVPIVQGQEEDKATLIPEMKSSPIETGIISEIEALAEHCKAQQEVPFHSDADEKQLEEMLNTRDHNRVDSSCWLVDCRSNATVDDASSMVVNGDIEEQRINDIEEELVSGNYSVENKFVSKLKFTENPDKKRLNEENLKMHDKLYLKEVHCESVNDRKYKYTKEKEEHNLVWIRNVNTCYAQYQMEMIQALTQSDLHEFPKSDLKELKVNPPARQDHRLLSRKRSQCANLFPISLDKECQNGKEKSQKNPSLKRGCESRQDINIACESKVMVLEELFDLRRIRASDNVDLCDAKVSMSKLDKYGRQNFPSRGTPFIKKRCRISAEMVINENQIVIHRNQRHVKSDLSRSVSEVDMLNQRCEAENRMLPLREKVKVPSNKILKRGTLISPRLRPMTRIRQRPNTITQRPPTAIAPRPPTVIVPRPPTAVFPRPPTAPRNKTFRRRVTFFSSNNQQLPPLHRHNADLSRRFL